MKTTASRASAVSQTRGFGDLLYDKAGSRPSLDLDFAGTSSLRDKITGEYLVDHTRASNATYIDSEGLVKEAPFNVHNATRFQHVGSTDKDTIANPFNVVEDIYYMDTANNHRSTGTGSTGSGGNSLTQMWAASVYMRTDQGTAEVEIDVNDRNKKVVTVTDQWQRFSAVQTTASNNNTYRFFDIQTSDNGTGSFGAVNKGFGPTFGGTQTTTKVYVWGAQLEKNEVTAYTGQNNSGGPRFTHERVETGNLLKGSENIWDTDYWTVVGSVVEPYFALAPDNTFTANRLYQPQSPSTYIHNAVTNLTVGQEYTASVYVKSTGTTSNFNFYASDATGYLNNTNNNLNTTTTDWTRYEISFTARYTTTNIGINSVGDSYAINALIWGFQLEEGNSASTYVSSIDTFTSRASSATYVDSAGLIKTAPVNLFPVSTPTVKSDWSSAGTNVGVTGNYAEAPDGTQTAVRLVMNAVSSTFFRIPISLVSGETYTFSAYIKSNHPTKNLATFIVTRVGGGSPQLVLETPTLTDEWVRHSFTFTANATGTANIGFDNFNATHDGGTAIDHLFWGVQVEEGSVATELIQTTGTATGAARYSHDPETLTPTGLYLEPAVTNVCKAPLFFDNNGNIRWSTSNTSFTANAAIAPDGTQTATLVKPNDTTSFPYVSGGSASATYVWSGFFKSAGYRYVHLWQHKANSSKGIIFDIIDGTITHNFSGNQTGFIQKYPNGWFRIGVKETASNFNGNFGFTLNKHPDGTNVNIYGRNTDLDDFDSGVYAWGLNRTEEEYLSSPIIHTVFADVTRAADVYTSTANLTETFEPRGLLIEEARTNLVYYSEDLSNTTWVKNSTVIGGTTTSPRGDNTAYLVKPNGSTTASYRLNQQLVGSLTGGTYTTSVFVKPAGLRYFHFRTGSGQLNIGTCFDLQEGIALSQGYFDGANVITASGGSTIEKYPNGWFRVTCTGNLSGQNYFLPAPSNSATTTAFDSSSLTSAGIYMWGFQIEAGSFATSYIPTTSSSATRSADIASITGDNFGTYRTNLMDSKYPNISVSGNNRFEHQHNAALGPFNKFDATKLIKDSASSYMRYSPTGSIIAQDTYTYTGYWKINSPDLKYLHIRHQDGKGKGFNLEDLSTFTGRYEIATFTTPEAFSITDVGNGWRKVTLTCTGSRSRFWIYLSRTSTHVNNTNSIPVTGESILVAHEQVEASSTPTNVIENPPTFTSRLGNATYVDSNGLIKTSYRNHVGYSEDLNFWNIHEAQISSQRFTAPDGTETAFKMVPNAVTTNISFVFEEVTANVTGTLSVYVKSDEFSHVNLVSWKSSSTAVKGVSFDLNNRTIQSSQNATGEIIDAGNGWSKIILRHTDSSYAPVYFLIQAHHGQTPNQNDFFRSTVTFNGSDGLLIWHPMKTDSLTDAGEYAPTTSLTKTGGPRYSHDPETLVPTGLYLEPARTNFIPKSNSFHYSNKWAPTGGSIAIDNSVAAPTGETGKVAVFTEDTSTGAHNINSSQASGGDLIQTNNSSSYSFFVKPLSTRNIVILRVNGIGTNTINLAVKLDNQTINYKEGESGTSSRNITWTVNAHVEKYQNNWYRVVINYLVNTTNATISYSPELSINFGESNDVTNVPSPYQGNGQKIMALFGLQNEVGRYASSYIETDGSAVTRAADTYTSTATTVLDRDGGNKKAFWSPTANTMFGHIQVQSLEGVKPYGRIFQTQSSTAYSQNIQFDNDKIYFRHFIEGTNYQEFLTHNLNNGDILKAALTVELNYLRGIFNGTFTSVDTNATLHNLPTDTKLPTSLSIGHRETNISHINNPISRITHWKTRLPDASLINITT